MWFWIFFVVVTGLQSSSGLWDSKGLNVVLGRGLLLRDKVFLNRRFEDEDRESEVCEHWLL